MEIIHHRAEVDQMHLVEYFTSKVIVHFFDGRLHIDVKGFPEGQPMTICIEDDTIFDQDAPEPPKPVWERNYSMFSDEGQASCEYWVQRATESSWPLATTIWDITEWVQRNVEAAGKEANNADRQAATFGEVYDTEPREEIYAALEEFVGRKNR